MNQEAVRETPNPEIKVADPLGVPAGNEESRASAELVAQLDVQELGWSYWSKVNGQSLSGFLQAALEIAFDRLDPKLHSGIPGSEYGNPVSLFLYDQILGFGGLGEIIKNDQARLDIDVMIPAPQNAICKVILSGGQSGKQRSRVIGHCPVPASLREWLKRFHAGEIPVFCLK